MSKLIIAITIVTAIALGVVAHAQDKDVSPVAGATGVVRGAVFLAPACPGPAQIDRPECAKRPVQTSVRVFAITSRNGSAVNGPLTTVATDARGQFRITLRAGTYRLVPVTSPGISRGKPSDIRVTAGSTVDVEILIDSGMR